MKLHFGEPFLRSYLCSSILCVFFAFALAPPSSLAWGCKGHQTVALIAERHLTPEALQFFQTLLSQNPVDPQLKRNCGPAVRDLLADSSTWPDDVRGELKNGSWHYIDIPRGAPRRP